MAKIFQETRNCEVFPSMLSNSSLFFFHCFSFTAQVLKLFSVVIFFPQSNPFSLCGQL